MNTFSLTIISFYIIRSVTPTAVKILTFIHRRLSFCKQFKSKRLFVVIKFYTKKRTGKKRKIDMKSTRRIIMTGRIFITHPKK